MRTAMQRRSRALRNTLVLLFSVPLLAQSPSTPNIGAQWESVNVAAAAVHLRALPADQALEQIGDWSLPSAYSDYAPATAVHREALVPFVPVRVDALAGLTFSRTGETRSLGLPDNRQLSILPESCEGSWRHQQVGRMLDKDREAKGPIAPAVIVFQYRVDSERKTVLIRKTTEGPGDALFREAAGYFDRRIATSADLDALLPLKVDLVHARLDNGALVLGGATL